MSHVSKVKVSPSLCRRLGALVDAHGMGHDERARAWADRGCVACCRWQHEWHNGGVRVGSQPAAYPADGQTVSRGWCGSDSARAAWSPVEQPDRDRAARGCHPSGPPTLCRFRADAGGRETARTAWAQSLMQDTENLDDGGWLGCRASSVERSTSHGSGANASAS